MSTTFGVSNDVVVLFADLPPPSLRKIGALGTLADGTEYTVQRVGGVLTWVINTGAPGPAGPAGPPGASGAIETLTYDPTAVPDSHVFNSVAALWAAYLLTTGAVDIVFTTGANFPLAGSPYVFRRDGTRVRGLPPAGNAFIQLSLDDGVEMRDLLDVANVDIRGSSTAAPVMTYTDPNPQVLLHTGASFSNNGTYPMIEWTQPNSAGQLWYTFQDKSGFHTLTAPVLSIQGTGPGPDVARVAMRLGQEGYVEANAIIGNVNSELQPQALDATADLSFNQPGYLGANSPLDPDGTLTVDGFTTLNTRGYTARSPKNAMAPQWLLIPGEVQTTDATPTNIIPVQTPPPVVSAGATIRVLARQGSTGDSAYWRYEALTIFTGGGGSFGPGGLVQQFYDASPGAASWTAQFLLNTPGPGQVSAIVTGEAGKTIDWTIVIDEALRLALP